MKVKAEAVTEQEMVSLSRNMMLLRSIILRRKVLPAGTTFAAKLSVPISESSTCFEHCDH